MVTLHVQHYCIRLFLRHGNGRTELKVKLYVIVSVFTQQQPCGSTWNRDWKHWLQHFTHFGR